ncbi:MAG: SGNH/GDSL hydrolase family protein [Planctomycetota bacterium]
MRRFQKRPSGVLPQAALIAVAAWAMPGESAAQPVQPAPDRWADALHAFGEQDAAKPCPAGGVVFVGSSSIRLWDLPRSFPEFQPPPLNRGFGGSELSDSLRHAERLVLRHRPRAVVMYAGDNDIAGGKSAAVVAADFRSFAERLHDRLPKTKLAYLAIKPSLARWRLACEMRKANALIAKACDADARLTFVDIWSPMIGADGRPRRDLFVEDGLHLNPAGYRLWAKVLRPFLPAPNAKVSSGNPEP